MCGSDSGRHTELTGRKDLAVGDAQGASVSIALLLMSVGFGTLRFSFPVCKNEDTAKCLHQKSVS